MADYVKIVAGLIGILVALYLLQAVLPLLFAFGSVNGTYTGSASWTNTSIWGSFGASIFPTIMPLLIAVAAVAFILVMVMGALKKGGGNYKL